MSKKDRIDALYGMIENEVAKIKEETGVQITRIELGWARFSSCKPEQLDSIHFYRDDIDGEKMPIFTNTDPAAKPVKAG